MVVTVCTGSCCHLRGAYRVLEKTKELIACRGLEDKITLKTTMCMGKCSDGVSVSVDGKYFSVKSEDLDEVTSYIEAELK